MHGNTDCAFGAIEHVESHGVTAETVSGQNAANQRQAAENICGAPPDIPNLVFRPEKGGHDERIDWVTQEIANVTDSLFSFAKRRLRNDTLADDAVHDTIVAALEAVDRFAAQSSVKTWLIGILKHKISDCERRTAREIPMPMVFADYSLTDPIESTGCGNDLEQVEMITPERTFESRQLLGICERALAELPPTMREVFMLRVVHDLGADETCRELGITPANLWVLQHRARTRLREDLSAYGIESSSANHRATVGRTGSSRWKTAQSSVES